MELILVYLQLVLLSCISTFYHCNCLIINMILIFAGLTHIFFLNLDRGNCSFDSWAWVELSVIINCCNICTFLDPHVNSEYQKENQFARDFQSNCSTKHAKAIFLFLSKKAVPLLKVTINTLIIQSQEQVNHSLLKLNIADFAVCKSQYNKYFSICLFYD